MQPGAFFDLSFLKTRWAILFSDLINKHKPERISLVHRVIISHFLHSSLSPLPHFSAFIFFPQFLTSPPHQFTGYHGDGSICLLPRLVSMWVLHPSHSMWCIVCWIWGSVPQCFLLNSKTDLVVMLRSHKVELDLFRTTSQFLMGEAAEWVLHKVFLVALHYKC